MRLRGFIAPASEQDPGFLYDAIQFARYKYIWKDLEFILYTVRFPYLLTVLEYILFPQDSDETTMSNSKATDALLMAVGQAQFPYKDDREYILVFDQGLWLKSAPLFHEVQKTTWDDVILDQGMKDTISHTIEEFFDNEKRYRDLDVPWKRGIIFYGPPGNGKTLSLRALMHSLSTRREHINLLYVKSIVRVWDIGSIFRVARTYSPCLLILEDIDTLVSGGFQSYFFNEVDGLANNDGIMMIATTNHIDRLDGGLANRPSRFDRKYNFPIPNFEERVLYAEFWRKKLQDKEAVHFPQALSPKIAKITEDFSFAYMKEAFIATLLALARNGPNGSGKDDKDLDDLPFWKEMQKEVKILRDEMRTKHEAVTVALLPMPHPPRLLPPDALNTAPPPQFDLTMPRNHLHPYQALPELTSAHWQTGGVSGHASTNPPPKKYHLEPPYIAPTGPSVSSSDPSGLFASQYARPRKIPIRERGHDLATLGLLSPQQDRDVVSLLDMAKSSLLLIKLGNDTV